MLDNQQMALVNVSVYIDSYTPHLLICVWDKLKNIHIGYHR